MRRLDEADQQLERQWRDWSSDNYRRTRQRGCDCWANRDFLRSGDGHGPVQLPVAKEWSPNQQRDFFYVHDYTYDSFRQWRAFRSSRCQ